MRQVFLLFIFTGLLCTLQVKAQQKDSTQPKQLSDSTLENKDKIYGGPTTTQAQRDSIDKKRKQSYHRATIYSAILPGAGQVYNKKYWKVPIVYAAIGIPAYFYFYNKNYYNDAQYALVVTINQTTDPDSLSKLNPDFVPLVKSGNTTAIINVRNEARKYQDYSVLYFLIFYALNIVDATVDAHLKDFNVNSDLSFKIKPMIVPGPSPSAGITLAFNLHKPRFRQLPLNY
jgi:Family of unknown function (DUF5683)